MPIGQYDLGNSSVEISTQVTLGYVRLTIKDSQDN